MPYLAMDDGIRIYYEDHGQGIMAESPHDAADRVKRFICES